MFNAFKWFAPRQLNGTTLHRGTGVFNDAQATTTLSGGTVYAITPTPGTGDGYASAPAVTLTTAPSGGTNATATAVIGNGRVINVAVSGAGLGYLVPPAVTFSGGGGSGAAGIGKLARDVLGLHPAASNFVAGA